MLLTETVIRYFVEVSTEIAAYSRLLTLGQ